MSKLSSLMKTIKMIANDRAAVISAIGSYGDDYFTQTAKNIRKMMSGIGTSGNLSQEDIDYTLQQAITTLHDPKTKWFGMEGNGMPFPCKADAIKAVVAYVQNIDNSGLKDKINRSIEGDIGANVQGYNEQDSKLIKNIFGGEYKDIEKNDDNIIKFIGLIETPCKLPKPQQYGQRMRYMNDYAEKAKMLGMVDAIRIVADNKDAIKKITACKAGDSIGDILQNSFKPVKQDVEDGGPGSGNWGHKGRQGKHGGSMKGGGKHNRSAKSEAFEAAQGSESLEGVSAPWINKKTGRKGWGQGYVTAKNDWVNRLTGEKNTKADKLIRKWAEKPPQDEKQRKNYDPILSAEHNVFKNGTIQQRKQFLDLKKEARMFDQRQEKLYEQLSQGQKMLYDSLTGHADLIDQNTGQVIQQEGRRDFKDLGTIDKTILLDLQQKMLGGEPRNEKWIQQYADSLLKKYGYDPKKYAGTALPSQSAQEQPKEEPKQEEPKQEQPKEQPKQEENAQNPAENTAQQTAEQSNVEQQPNTVQAQQGAQETEQNSSENSSQNNEEQNTYTPVDVTQNENFKYHVDSYLTDDVSKIEDEIWEDLNWYDEKVYNSSIGSDVEKKIKGSAQSIDYYMHTLSSGMKEAASDESTSAWNFIPFVNRVVQMLSINGTLSDSQKQMSVDSFNGLNDQQKQKVSKLLSQLGVQGKPLSSLSTASMNKSVQNRQKVYDLLTALCKVGGKSILPQPQDASAMQDRKDQYEEYVRDTIQNELKKKIQQKKKYEQQNAQQFMGIQKSVQKATDLNGVKASLMGHGFVKNNYGDGYVKDIRSAKQQVGATMSVISKIPIITQTIKGFDHNDDNNALSAVFLYPDGGSMFTSALLKDYTMQDANKIRDEQIAQKLKVSGVQMYDKYTISAVHQCGHIIHNFLQQKAYLDVQQFVSNIFKQATGQKIKVGYKQYEGVVMQHLSKYANSKTSGHQMFAQMFCQAYLAPNPRPVAKLFKKRLGEYLDKKGIPNTLFDQNPYKSGKMY